MNQLENNEVVCICKQCGGYFMDRHDTNKCPECFENYKPKPKSVAKVNPERDYDYDYVGDWGICYLPQAEYLEEVNNRLRKYWEESTMHGADYRASVAGYPRAEVCNG